MILTRVCGRVSFKKLRERKEVRAVGEEKMPTIELVTHLEDDPESRGCGPDCAPEPGCSPTDSCSPARDCTLD